MISVRSTFRLMIQRVESAVPEGAALVATAAMVACESGKSDFLRSVVPDGLLLVLERDRRQVSADGGLLSHRRRRDDLLLAEDALDEILEVVNGAITLVEIFGAVQVDRLARFD